MNEIKIVITLDNLKLISVNALYRAGLIYKGGKPVPYIYKIADAKKFEGIVDEQLKAIDWTPYLDMLKETKYFKITNQYILKSGLSSRDVSNFTKLTDDTITRFIHGTLGISSFDDSKFIEEHLYKSIMPGSDKEYLCVSLSPSDFNYRFDIIDNKPSVFKFHTTDKSFETKGFKKYMKEHNLKYKTTGDLIKSGKPFEYDSEFYWISKNDNFSSLVSQVAWYMEVSMENKNKENRHNLFFAISETLDNAEDLLKSLKGKEGTYPGILGKDETVEQFLDKVYFG